MSALGRDGSDSLRAHFPCVTYGIPECLAQLRALKPVWGSPASLILGSSITSAAQQQACILCSSVSLWEHGHNWNRGLWPRLYPSWALHWKCAALRSWKALSWCSPGRAGHRSLASYFKTFGPKSNLKYSWGYLPHGVSFPANDLADRASPGPASLPCYSPSLSCSHPVPHQRFGNDSLRGHGCEGSQAFLLFIRSSSLQTITATALLNHLLWLCRTCRAITQAGQVFLSHTASQWCLLLAAHTPLLSHHPV